MSLIAELFIALSTIYGGVLVLAYLLVCRILRRSERRRRRGAVEWQRTSASASASAGETGGEP